MLRSDPLGAEPLVELAVGREVRRELALPREDPLRVLFGLGDRLEREERDDAADVFLATAEAFLAAAEVFLAVLRWAPLRALVVALRAPPEPLLAVLRAVFRPVCF